MISTNNSPDGQVFIALVSTVGAIFLITEVVR